MLARGQDNALLRFTLGELHFKRGAHVQAIEHLSKAVDQDPQYSAAWKLYGQALAAAGRKSEALTAYDRGIEVAEGRGDLQAAKEMQIFTKRLRKHPTEG